MLCASVRESPSMPRWVQSPAAMARRKPWRAVAAGLCVGAGGEEAAVVVRAAGERLAPGGLAVRRDALALGHLLEFLLREPPGDGAQQAVGPARARPVAPLEHVEEQQHALHGVRCEATAHVEERVREVVRHLGLAQDRHEVVDVLAGRVRHRERGLVDAERHHVRALPVLREPRVELAAEKSPRQVRDSQGAGECVGGW